VPGAGWGAVIARACSRAWRALAGWWFAPLPAERLAALRVLVGLFALAYLSSRLGQLLALPGLPRGSWRPVGAVELLTSTPWPRPVVTALVLATWALAVAFVLGLAHRWLAPVFALLLLLVLTYRNSWGMVFHTENLLVLHVGVVALAPASDAWSLDRWRADRRGAAPAPADGRHAWAVRTAAALTVITYVLAGLAKVRLGGDAWTTGDQLRNQIAMDNARKLLLGDAMAPLATLLLDHPRVLGALAWSTLVLELGAPVALLGGWWARAWAVSAWGFHLGVVLLMAIVFPYPLVGVAYAPLLAVERPPQRVLAWWRRRRGGR
jgi:hypothetical protein